MEISFIHTVSRLVQLHVNTTNFHAENFKLGFALKQRRKATRKVPVADTLKMKCEPKQLREKKLVELISTKTRIAEARSIND